MDVRLGYVLILGAFVIWLFLWWRRRQETVVPTPLTEGVVAALGPQALTDWDYTKLPDGLLRDMASAVPGSWFERWTPDCGGSRLPFAVAFMPQDDGVTRLLVSLLE